MNEFEREDYDDDDFCWKCGTLLGEEEIFMGLCDECLEKEMGGIEGFPKKRRFDDEEGR